MNKYIILFLTLFLIGVTFVHAADPNLSNYDYNVEAFKRTRDLCQKVQSESMDPQEVESNVDTVKMAAFLGQGIKNGLIIWEPESFRVSADVTTLIHSDGFKSALYACFGSNQFKQNLFESILVGEDIVGHIIGISVWMLPVSVLARKIKKTSWALNNPKVVSGIGRFVSTANKIAIVVFAAYLGIDEYFRHETNVHSKERLDELNESVVDNSKQEEDDSFQILKDLLDDTDKKLSHAEASKDTDRIKSLAHRKQLLEERLKGHHFSKGD